MKLTDLKPGDRIRPGPHWGCLYPSETRVVQEDEAGLYVWCREGKHYLDWTLENIERVT